MSLTTLAAFATKEAWNSRRHDHEQNKTRNILILNERLEDADAAVRLCATFLSDEGTLKTLAASHVISKFCEL